MQRPQGSDDDPFVKVAIPFILSVVVGFSLILLGFIFLSLAGLSAIADTNETPALVWLALGIVSEIVGVYLMKWALGDSPAPGDFGPGGKHSRK